MIRGLAAVALAAAAAAAQALSPAAEIGRQMFFDATLSGSGKMSCASCHDPAHAYAPANDRAVQLGGLDGRTPGTRAVPTLMYKEYINAYSDEYENPDQKTAAAPGGGFTWDGRASTLAEQAAVPLLAPNEMANADARAVAAKLAAAPYAVGFKRIFGARIFDDPGRAFARGLEALQAFQLEDPSFHPYASKFDRYRNNKVGGTLTEAEMRGLQVFIDPAKGNCMACHLLGAGNRGSHDMLSDYSYAALGVPRNPEIPANADPEYFDQGLCGPLRSDHPGRYCGMFKTPTLRNVATRRVFMHNGYFKSLRDVVRFYNLRDVQPELWYPNGRKFDDLPPAAIANLDRSPPLDQRAAGSKPAMTDQDVEDLLVFLGTLTDEP